MKATIKTMLLMLTALLAVIGMAECKKSNPSIIGKWTMTTYKHWIHFNNGIIEDNTFVDSNSKDTIVFYTNGKCNIGNRISPIDGSYSLVGNTITISHINTNGNLGTPIIDTIISLTEHSLILSQMAGVNYSVSNYNTDTTIIYTYHYTFGYSR